MPSLRELLAAHAPLLLIDAASSRVQTAWLAGAAESHWQTSDEEAGVAIFRAIEALGCDIAAANAFVFCAGPGSILGVRTAAMALRAWNVVRARPMFAYSSLAVVAHALGRTDVAVIADARRDSWHHYRIGLGLRRVETAALSGELVTPAGFRNWTPLPPATQQVSYSLSELLPKVEASELFLETAAPDAFLHEEPSYVTWTPRIHRAPPR